MGEVVPVVVFLISKSLEFVPEANGSAVSGMPSIAVGIQTPIIISFYQGLGLGVEVP